MYLASKNDQASFNPFFCNTELEVIIGGSQI